MILCQGVSKILTANRIWQIFLSDPGVPGPIFGSSCLSLRIPCADLTDVTLADEDTNSIRTDNANRTIQGNEAMQVTQPGRKICNYASCAICNYANGAI